MPTKLEFQSSSASRVRQRLHFPVITKTSSVKYHSLDVFLQTSFSDKRTEFCCHRYVSVCPAISLHTRLYGRRRSHGLAQRIVDHLCINMPPGEVHRETRTLRRASNTPADSLMSNFYAIDRFHFLSKRQIGSVPAWKVVTGPSCLPYAVSVRQCTGSPYPCTVLADNTTEYRRRPDQPFVCRFPRSKSWCFRQP